MRISDWSSYVCSSDLSASPALKTDDVRRRDGGSMDAHDIAPCPLRLIAREVRAAQRVAGGGGGRRDGGDADAGGHRVKIPVPSDRPCGHALSPPIQIHPSGLPPAIEQEFSQFASAQADDLN